MPLSKYYGGHGEEVMRDMKERYGEERGEEIFYATENEKKGKKSKKHKEATKKYYKKHKKKKHGKKKKHSNPYRQLDSK